MVVEIARNSNLPNGVNRIVRDVQNVGRLDDLIMLCVALDSVLNHVPQKVLDDYWQGDQAVLDTIRSIVSTAVEFVPPQLLRTLYPNEPH
jgi:hypothetical protein